MKTELVKDYDSRDFTDLLNRELRELEKSKFTIVDIKYQRAFFGTGTGTGEYSALILYK